MIPQERLKPLILSEKSSIRSTVVKYFGDAHSLDEDLLPLVLDACDRYGDENCTLMLTNSQLFPFSELSAVRIFNKLKSTTLPIPILHFDRLLARCPLDYFQEHKKEILSHKNISLATRNRLLRRVFYSQKPAEELWEKLKTISRAWWGIESNKIPKTLQKSLELFERDSIFNTVDDLVEQLSPTPIPPKEEIIHLIHFPETSGSYMELFLVDLIGRRKIEECLPLLVDMYETGDEYDDSLQEFLTRALGRFQNVNVVTQLRSRYRSATELEATFFLDILAETKLPESEDALIDILQTETDIVNRSWACMALCELISEQGLPVVIQQVIAGYDDSLTDLMEEAEITAEIIGIEIPQTDEWLQAKKRDEDRKQNRKLYGWSLFPEHKPNAPLLSPVGLLNQKPEAKQKPVLPVAYKASRNDPCPCGSGKKYKKCCGKSA